MEHEKSKNTEKKSEQAVPERIEEKVQRDKVDEKLDEITGRDNPSDRFPEQRRS